LQEKKWGGEWGGGLDRLEVFSKTKAPESFFALSLTTPNLLLRPSVGFLDLKGRAKARFDVPVGLPLHLKGLLMDHAFFVLDPKALSVDFTSIPFSLLFRR
jgi:hypothetical protein